MRKFKSGNYDGIIVLGFKCYMSLEIYGKYFILNDYEFHDIKTIHLKFLKHVYENNKGCA